MRGDGNGTSTNRTDRKLTPPHLGDPKITGGGQDQDQDQQRRAERNRQTIEGHKNKRRELEQLELEKMMWKAPDKDG